MKHILDRFNRPYEYIEFENISIGILKNDTDNYNFIQYINGLNSYNGGKPIEYIESNFISAFKELLPKKYKDIKTGDIRNKITIITIFKHMKRPRFEDQVKSKCINSITSFKDISTDLDFVLLAKLVYKNQEIKDNITEYYDMKADYEAKKALKDLNKPIKKLRIEKYKPAINTQTYFMIAEGNSARDAILSATGRDSIGSYALKGKVMNCIKASISQLKKNQEIKDIIDILNMSLVNDTEVSYDNLLIATDADLDGSNITMLILTLFITYRPDLVKSGFIKILKTPIVVAYKNQKPKDFLFEFEELQEHQKNNKGFDYKYKKGLASMDESEYEIMFKDVIEDYTETLEWSDELPEVFDAWMGTDTQKRKDMLEGHEFDLFLV